jgi:hypothetical protein
VSRSETDLPVLSAPISHSSTPAECHAFLARLSGFYKAPGEFLNSNDAHGVCVSNLNSPYWQQHWLSAGRVLHA